MGLPLWFLFKIGAWGKRTNLASMLNVPLVFAVGNSSDHVVAVAGGYGRAQKQALSRRLTW